MTDVGQFKVRWSQASARVIPSFRVRYYRRLRIGHMRVICDDKVDRSLCCFNCGVREHIMAECNAAPKCSLCVDTGSRRTIDWEVRGAYSRPSRTKRHSQTQEEEWNGSGVLFAETQVELTWKTPKVVNSRRRLGTASQFIGKNVDECSDRGKEEKT